MNSLNKKTVLLFSILILVLSSLSCNSVKDVEYVGVKETNIESMALNKGVAKIVLTYFNPNNFGLDIKETDVEVFANDQFLGTAENAAEFAVPKNDTFDFPVYVHFNPIKMLSLAAKNANLKKVQLKIKGTTKIGKQGVFIKVPVNVSEEVTIR